MHEGCVKMLVQHRLPCEETAQLTIQNILSHLRCATRKIKDEHYTNLDLDDAASQTFPGLDFNQN